ncbi:MAG TPA: S8 family serine peptidase [Povalibacter sp.]|nr:S8 family serine peptidase [Povalibacter sp.]
MLIRALLVAALLLTSVAAPAATAFLLPAQALAEPQRHIVVTVANRQAVRPGTVGGTVRGYQGGGDYRAGPAALAAVKELSRRYQLTVVSEWPIEQLQVHCIVFRIADTATRVSVLEQLQSDRDVVLAQPLNEFGSATVEYDDPYARLQDNARALDLPEAQRFSRGRGIRIAVIDTGIDTGHPDFTGRVELGGNFVDNDLAALRNDRHGTEVAGLIAAAANNGIGIVGVAPDVKLLAFKACWQDKVTSVGRCNSFTLAQALAAAITARVEVINLSLVGPADPLLSELVAKAVDAHVIVVGAASREDNAKSFPGGLHDILAVTESEADSSDERLLRAPGRNIVTLVPQGHYDFASGSSLSTAQVTGVVALLLERNRRLTSDEVQQMLRSSTEPRPTSQGPLNSINACRALAAIVTDANCSAHAE